MPERQRPDEPRWFYVGNGQLRFKDAQGWTDQYQNIADGAAGRPKRSGSQGRPTEGEPTEGEPTVPATPTARTKLARRVRPPRKTPVLATAVCAGLLGLAVVSGQLNVEVVQGWGSWATDRARELSSLVVPASPAMDATSEDARLTSVQKPKEPQTKKRLTHKKQPKRAMTTPAR